MKTHYISCLILSIFLMSGCSYLTGEKGKYQRENIQATARKGEFVITVHATGELRAKRSEQIKAPFQEMRAARVRQTTISDMVPEGTIVNQGEYVATLDRMEITQNQNEIQNELDKIYTQYDQAVIDTAIELRGLRDQLINLKYSMQEKELQVEQSKYEPQMVIRQAEIELEKAKRDYDQLLKKFDLTQEKAGAKLAEINTQLERNHMKLNRLEKLAQKFIVKAPKNGMVIYARNWRGKIGPGSEVNTWDPIVAELPDLSEMISKTYVNEVDISRVKKGQDAKIRVDAFPDEIYTGTVIKVANVGEQLRGYDSKVFEVIVKINETDSILRPAMTSNIEIITDIIPDVVSVPLEALQNDTLTHVFLENAGNLVRKEVIAGLTNDNEVIIDYGLEGGEKILLTTPKNPEAILFEGLSESIKEEIRKKQEEKMQIREARIQERIKEVKDEEYSDDGGHSGNVIIFR